MASGKSSPRPLVAPSVKTVAAISLAALMAACATSHHRPSASASPPPGVGPTAPTGAQVQSREGVTPPFMRGRQIVRVGLLLPFTVSPQEASALYNAAELALFDHGDQNTLLIPRDAGADANSANAAARALVNDGADIIIGPVLRDSVVGAAGAARTSNIPVIGFSSDRAVAGNGVYLLSFQLEDEIARMVSFAARQNISSIALLAPANDYGRRVEHALRLEGAARGVTIVTAQLYNRTDADAAAAATALAATLQTTPAQGIMIAESGSPLRAIATSLVRGGVDQHTVRFMGTSAWTGDAQREPTLAGGWYVSADPSSRSTFETHYTATFGERPTRMASMGYDAVALATLLSHDTGPSGFARNRIENSDGFAGSDGLFRFRSSGAIERGLAIIQVGQNQVAVLDAAPRAFPHT